MLADLDLKQEVMEDEIESNALAQSLRLSDLKTEILKLETALNMTVSHWAEMKSGHGEFANKTLTVLSNLMNLATRTTTQSPDNGTSEDVQAENEEDVTPSSASTHVFHNCSKVAKFQSEDIICTASSQFNRKFRSRIPNEMILFVVKT